MPSSWTISGLLSEFTNSNHYKPYISSIVFTAYKNINYGAELKLDFPLTLLIGKNGTNKSSVLQALYGCPEGKSVGEYWFSTHVDEITDINGRRPAFFYRYSIPGTGSEAEVLKTRINKKTDPDYWEPSRPILEYGMRPVPSIARGAIMPNGRLKTRWKAIDKNVLYLDFRGEISAFDKAFYKLDRSEKRSEHRNKLRKQSKPLKEVIENNLQSKTYHSRERVFINYTFSEAERKIVSHILGNDYSNIIYVEHNFYLSGSFSIYVKKGQTSNYSEAFAGSGETSVIRLVYALNKALNKTLVLLDEPETSLHIEAQVRLKNFLLEQIHAKKLQIIVSTHSPFLADGLPESAIKILQVDEISKRVSIINSAPADESSFYLGYRRNSANKVNIIVEDILTQAISQHVCNKLLTNTQQDKIAINHYSGGKNGILDLAVSEMLKENSNVVFLFDGDQRPTNGIPDPDEIPSSRDNTLRELIQETFGSVPHFPFDSNNGDQRTLYYRKFLKFASIRFSYFPFNSPEEFLVNTIDRLTNAANSADAKFKLDQYAQQILASSGSIKSADILTLQRQLISEISMENTCFLRIKEILSFLVTFAPNI